MTFWTDCRPTKIERLSVPFDIPILGAESAICNQRLLTEPPRFFMRPRLSQGNLPAVFPRGLDDHRTPQGGLHGLPGHAVQDGRRVAGDQLAGDPVDARPAVAQHRQQLQTVRLRLPGQCSSLLVT